MLVSLAGLFLSVRASKGGGGETNANAVSRCCETLNRVGPVSSLSFLSFPHLNFNLNLFTYTSTVVTCYLILSKLKKITN